MDYSKFIEPVEIKIGDDIFAISKIPAIDSIAIYRDICKSFMENGPIGLTMIPRECIVKMLSFTAMKSGDEWITIETQMMINQLFTKDFKALQTIILTMIRENYSFLVNGGLETLLKETSAVAMG
jgi:hypothetical protein